MKKLKIAMIGFGGIARAHYSGYRLLAEREAPISLVAVCDCDPTQFDRPVKINTATQQTGLDPAIHTYTDVDSLLANEDFDVADVCLPTYLHCEFTVKLLRAGKHVLCEKPMALSGEDCARMLAAARESGKRLMVAQCLRFHRAYLYLKKAIDEGTYGALRRLEMNRLSAHPTWGFENWFCDTERSGGCILDMHIHDVDMARFLLGEPEAVSAISYDGRTRWQMENTRMFYPDTMVVINGSWDETKGTPFVWNYRAVFERGTLISLQDERVQVYPEDGEPFVADPEGIDSYAREIEFFADTILRDLPNEVNSPESAARTVRTVELLRESAARGGEKLSAAGL